MSSNPVTAEAGGLDMGSGGAAGHDKAEDSVDVGEGERGGDRKPEMGDVADSGSTVGAEEAPAGGAARGGVEADGIGIQIEVADVCAGAELREGGACCGEEDRMMEERDELGNDQRGKMEVAKAPVAAVGGFETEGVESLMNQGGEQVEIRNGSEITKDVVSFVEKNQRTLDDVTGHDLVDGCAQKSEVIVAEAGSTMGTEAVVEAALEGFQAGRLAGLPNPGEAQVGHVEISQGAEIRVKGVSCDEESLSTNRVISHDFLDVHVQTSVGILDDRGWETEDRSVGDQKSETEVVGTGSLERTAKAPIADSVEVFGTGGLEGEPEVEVAEIFKGTEQVEEDFSCPDNNQSSVNDVMGHDLLDSHFQATEGVLGHRDNSQNQAEVVAGFTTGTEDMSNGLSLGINQDTEAQAMVGNTEVHDGSMIKGNPDKFCETSVSRTSLVDMNLEEVRKVEPMPVDDTTTDLADDVSKDSYLAVPVVKVQNLDSHSPDQNPMEKGDFVTAGSDTSTALPVGGADNGDGHLLNDDRVGTGSFVTTDVGLAKVVVDMEVAQTAEIHPVDENAIDKGVADVDSITTASVLESQSRDTHLSDENPNGKGDYNTQAADTCPLDENLMDKGDSVVEDPISVVEISVPEISEQSEIRTLVSQTQESVDSPLGDNQEMGVLSVGSLADGSPGANAPEVESSPGRVRMDMESDVLKEGFSPPADSCQEVEVVQKSEAELQTLAPRDSVENVVMDEDTLHIEEQELLESAENQTLQCVKIAPWTLSMENNQRARYYLPPQYMTKFSISDLVWGKVKSHPWWPGQIFDPLDASDMALKHQRKDNFLVAYFGDKTFAWCDESQLKLFYKNFSHMEKQSSSDVFINAVNEVLGEVSRRVELGMTCSCLPEENYTNVKYKKIENAGIREGIDASSFDRSLIVNYFQPDRILEYIKALAQLPTGGVDKLEFVIAQAQLKAFYHSKGYPELPEFIVGGWLVENDVKISPSGDKKPTEDTVEHFNPMPSEAISGKRKRGRPPKKQKHILEDGRKQKSLSELMEEKSISHLENGGKSGFGVKAAEMSNSCNSGKKWKVDSDSADSGKSKRKRLDSLGDLETKSPSPTLGSSFEVGDYIANSGKSKKKRQDSIGDLETKSPSSILHSSFKVGECIRRVASQLTGSPPILKCHGETFQKSVSKADYRRGDAVGIDAFPYAPAQNRRTKKGVSEEYSSPDEMLSQLCLAARDPMKGYSFLYEIVSFFTYFRNSIASNSSDDSKHNEKTGIKRGRKKTVNSESASSDMSTPDHMKDSYWSDMISHNSSEKGLFSNGLKRKGETDMRRQKKRRKSAGQSSSSLLLGPIMDTAQQLQFGAVSPNMKPSLAAERSIISVEEKIVDTPTALILSFNSSDSLPSETDLIRIFGRYGPLREAETEVLRKTNRVKVVFKRRTDAEIAFSSAGKFSVFGPSLVSYRLKYLSSAMKTSPDTSPEAKDDTAPIEDGNSLVSAQAETGVVSDTAQVEAVANG